MTAENKNKLKKKKTNTNTGKGTFTLVTLQRFIILRVILAEKSLKKLTYVCMTGSTAPSHSNVGELQVFLGNITLCDVNLRWTTKIYIDAVSVFGISFSFSSI